MLDQLTNLANRLRGSLWLVPAAISAATSGVAWLLLYSGLTIASSGGEHWWLFSGDAATARDVLASLLTGVITVASLAISITIVVLSLAAQQLGPRVIESFMGDRTIQSVLGLFLGTILYTLFVLRSVTGDLGAAGIPHIAITAAGTLTALCLFMLLFYVHKLARSIIADTVIDQIAGNLEASLANGRHGADGEAAVQVAPGNFRHTAWLSLGRTGFIQVIDYARLCGIAERHDLLLRLNVRAGHFLLRGGEHVQVLADVAPAELPESEIRRCFVLGSERTPTQDVEYSMRQLVEIAVRALSPGVNDPYTAVAVINRLAAALELAADRLTPLMLYRDPAHRPRVIGPVSDFAGLLDAAFNQVRQAAAANPAVLIRLCEMLGQLACVLKAEHCRRPLAAHLEKVERAAHQAVTDAADLRDFAEHAARARRQLSPSGSPAR